MRGIQDRLVQTFALCLLPFAFCFRSPADQQPLPESDPTPLGPPAAVVQLLAIGPGAGDQNKECAATGILVNEDGVILTNAHVVEDARRCLAGTSGAKIVAKFARPGARTAEAVSCDVVGLDEIHDLALVKTERPLRADQPSGFVLLNASGAAEGTRVAVTGHSAYAWQPTTQMGKVIGREKLALSEKSSEQSEVLILDIALRRGASGSPVYLESGSVVGLIERQNPARPSETVVVPIRYALDLLARYGVRWHARSAPR